VRRAIRHDEFRLLYQLKVSGSRFVTGVEGLLRWESDGQTLLPDQFIGEAERSGAISDISRWALREGIGFSRTCRDLGFVVPVAINLSARDLLDESLPRFVEHALREHRLQPSALRVEVTETVFFDGDRCGVADRLHSGGVHVSIDDFGAGYSNLTRLRQFTFSELKLDRALARDLVVSPQAQDIVQWCAGLGHAFGATVVAEGLETPAAFRMALRLGCDAGQGHALSMPLEAEEVIPHAVEMGYAIARALPAALPTAFPRTSIQVAHG
jgi:EAL domain-containing protein (putative c-di-GMP-specific phosphodiesterase class I)